MKPSLGISNFLVEISSLSHSVVFSISLFRVGQINQLKVLILRESIPREVDKNSGALKEEIRVWNSQGGGKDKIFFFFFISTFLPFSYIKHFFFFEPGTDDYTINNSV